MRSWATATFVLLGLSAYDARAESKSVGAETLGAPPKERGVGLGLFSADPHFAYRGLVREIASLGATHILVSWVWWQDDLRASRISPVDGWSATDEQIVETIREARRLGLHVSALPILRLVSAAPGEWRGRIEPSDPKAWWSSYEAFILRAAELSVKGGAQRLSIGSELLSREHERVRWIGLIGRVRAAAPGLELTYSANWDHFRHVSFWDVLDVVGLTGYWELTKDLDAETRELAFAWRGIKTNLVAWSRELGRPILLTEVGYPSLDGAAAWPWDETRRGTPDMEEQRRAYEAFILEWSGTPELSGVFFWNWFGFGGPGDTGYTPRKKPAEDLIRRWYRAAPEAP